MGWKWGQSRAQEAHRKPSISIKTPHFLNEYIYQDSYTVHGLYRGQKVLEPQKFAVTLQWVGSEVNRGHLSPVGNVRGHLFPSQIRQSESQLPRLRLLIWVFGRGPSLYYVSAKRWVGGAWGWLNADVSWHCQWVGVAKYWCEHKKIIKWKKGQASVFLGKLTWIEGVLMMFTDKVGG